MNKRDITFYYTNEQMAKDLISILPIKETDTVLDAGSGKNKVWFNNLTVKEKYECEIEDGCDFYKWDKRVDWVIGNPPFHEGWKFVEKAMSISNKGIAFLGNINFFNQFTTRRLDILKNNGFELQRIHIVSDKRWFGRYYFLIFEKKRGILSWGSKAY